MNQLNVESAMNVSHRPDCDETDRLTRQTFRITLYNMCLVALGTPEHWYLQPYTMYQIDKTLH